MATPYELDILEQMIAHARHLEHMRALERKAAIAEITRPEELAALEMVERAKEDVNSRVNSRKRLREKED